MTIRLPALVMPGRRRRRRGSDADTGWVLTGDYSAVRPPALLRAGGALVRQRRPGGHARRRGGPRARRPALRGGPRGRQRAAGATTRRRAWRWCASSAWASAATRRTSPSTRRAAPSSAATTRPCCCASTWTPGLVVQTYSTAAFADADGLPETAWMLARGDRLFIACQKLDRPGGYAPSGPGTLLVFDMAAGQWVDADPAAAGVQPITLAGGNPYTRIEAFGVDGQERLRVGCVGCVRRRSTAASTRSIRVALTSLGWVVTEAQLGGDISAFVSTAAAEHLRRGHRFRHATTRTSCAGRAGRARRWSVPATASCSRTWPGTAAAALFLADRTPFADGLRVFDACTGQPLTAAPVATGLPPFSFVLPADPVAAPAPPVPAASALQPGGAVPESLQSVGPAGRRRAGRPGRAGPDHRPGGSRRRQPVAAPGCRRPRRGRIRRPRCPTGAPCRPASTA